MNRPISNRAVDTQQSFEVEHHGQLIRGTAYRPTTVKRVPAVLMLHGFTGSRVESGFAFVQISRALVERGIAAVTFDFLNSGESDGSFEQMLASGELADALRMTEWIQGQPFVDRSRLALLGFSLGGLLAACVSGRSTAYKGLVLWAPTTPQNLVGNVCKRGGNDCPAGDPLVVGPYVMHPNFVEDLLKLDPLAEVVRHPRPTLLVQGTGDTAVPPAVSQQFVDAMNKAGIAVQHELVDGADHVFSQPEWRTRLVKVIVDWLVERLLAPSPNPGGVSGRGPG